MEPSEKNERPRPKPYLNGGRTTLSQETAQVRLLRPIRIVIADDHPVLLQGLAGLLNEEPDFKVLAACQDGAAARDAICKLSPDIALLDLRLPKLTGLEVMDEVSCTATRIVIFTAFAADHEALAAIGRGAYGLLTKGSAAGLLIASLRKVAAGFRCVPVEKAGASAFVPPLTMRERGVMHLVAQGLSNKDVARHLHVSEGTVKLHLHHIFCKTGVRRRAALAATLAGRIEAHRAE